jgi:hypothetical protein
MIICKICNNLFQEHTTTLPADTCFTCYHTKVKTIEIPLTKEEKINRCREIIDLCSKNITKYQQKIDDAVASQKYWCDTLNQLTMSELEEKL